MKPLPSLIFLPACLAVVGCTSTMVRTATDSAATGVSYYLPKQFLDVTFERKKAPSAAAISNAKTAAAAAAAVVEELAEKLERQQAELAELTKQKKDDAAIAAQKSLVAVTSAQLALAQINHTAKAAEYQTITSLHRTDSGCDLVDSIRITPSAVVADTAQRYVAWLDHPATRSDNLLLKTNAKGLLSNTEATGDDQTGSIILSLAQAVAGFGGGSPLAGVRNFSLTEKATDRTAEIFCSKNPFSVTLFVDPMQSGSGIVDGFSAALKSYDPEAAYQLRVTPQFTAQTTAPSAASSGLYYRRKLPWLVEVLDGDKRVKSLLLELPNQAPAEVLTLEASSFAKTQHTVEFENGMLVSHKADRPSGAAEVAKLPVNILKALVSVPTELLQLRVNYSKQEVELTQAQTALINAQQALQTAQEVAKPE